MFENITGLIENGKPVEILFCKDKGTTNPLLYCELTQKARFGESFMISRQGCSVCEYVFGKIERSPEDYYYNSARYSNFTAASNAVLSLKRISKEKESIKITPYSGGKFDVLVLYLKPEKAMRIIQAHAYLNGEPVMVNTGGVASICSDCTAYPMQGKLGISFGCKGSRKHSRYGDDEVIVGIPFSIAKEIDEALGRLPGIFS